MLKVVFFGGAERSKKISSSVKVYSCLSWKVRSWAIDILAIEFGFSIGIIKTA